MAKFWKQNWFKAGVALVGAKFAGEYFFGDMMPGGVSGEGTPYFSGDNLSANTLNYFGVTPFKATGIGSSIYGAVDDFIPDSVKDGYDFFKKTIKGSGAEKSASFLNMFGRDMGGMPSGTRSTQARSIRTDTNFQAGQAPQIPLGKNGRVSTALASGKMNDFLSGHVKATYVPARILANIRPVGSTSLGRVSVKRSATRSPAYTKDARIG